VPVEILRDGGSQTIDVSLAEAPAQ
jgi:hypothetical protein